MGDLVIAWDEATGETSPQRVTALIRPQPKLLWRLELRNADGETETFHATDDHPWYVEGEGWVETRHLRPRQRIETADDRGLLILDIARTDRVERTYNLTISGLHTFLVGEDGAVVHNQTICARAAALAARLGRNRVTLRSPSVRIDIDLAGRAHGGILTQHIRISQRNWNAPAHLGPVYNTGQASYRAATWADLRMVERFLGW